MIFVGFASAVTALTLAQRAGVFPLSAIASTPDSFWDGRIWLILTSAPVAQSPLSLSLMSLIVVALAVLWSCGSRVLWLSAVIGHAGSTLVLYAAIGGLALADCIEIARRHVRQPLIVCVSMHGSKKHALDAERAVVRGTLAAYTDATGVTTDVALVVAADPAETAIGSTMKLRRSDRRPGGGGRADASGGRCR